ncbi:hypothetical protein BKA93DRAFT_34926 [Sparassis latifolia]
MVLHRDAPTSAQVGKWGSQEGLGTKSDSPSQPHQPLPLSFAQLENAQSARSLFQYRASSQIRPFQVVLHLALLFTSYAVRDSSGVVVVCCGSTLYPTVNSLQVCTALSLPSSRETRCSQSLVADSSRRLDLHNPPVYDEVVSCMPSVKSTI